METQDVSVLRQALPYLQKYRDQIFVIKVGGELVQHPETLQTFTQDITLLQLVGIRVVVVHGGGPQATALSEKLGWKPEIIQGRRVTTEGDLDVAKMVFAGKINVEILSSLQKAGSRAVGLSGIDSRIIQAKKREATKVKDPKTGEEKQVDFGHVGDIVSVDPRLILDLMEKRYIPVIASLAADLTGNVFNINADTVGGEIAKSLKAAKYIALTDVPGVMIPQSNGEKKVASTLTVAQAELEIARGTITGGMIPKIQACLSAVKGGVHRAHVLDGFKPSSILVEVFTQRGTGTMILDEMEEDVYTRELAQQ